MVIFNHIKGLPCNKRLYFLLSEEYMDLNLPRMEHAIVIGASISGLMAARALANYFKQVTVIERDILPPVGEPRKGVPQGRHAHVLLSRGCDLLESFFPGLTQELVGQGAMAGDLSETVRWFSDGAYTRNFHSGLFSMQASRPLLEGNVYRRLCALPNLTLLENHDATGLLTTPGGKGIDVRVTGLRVVDRSQAKPAEKTLEADLVVDAGGRGSRGITWLESMGYPRPEEEHIKMDLAYTTREFRRLPEHVGGHSPVVILPSDKNRRGATLLAVEGGRWIVTQAAYLGDAAPADLEGFIAFAHSLDAPDCYEVVKNAEPLGEASTYKYPASQRRHYEKLTRFPEGYLVVGDAICSFNPIYGQGMTTAASEAALLDECLREGLPGLARRFFRRASRLLDAPWNIAAGGDLAYPEVEGKHVPAQRLVGMYLDRLLKASREDTVLNVAFQRVTNLLDPPANLFRPNIVIRVLLGNLKR
jgi:2-polyprenyl-6-methoxyphenol hydroxylase-like FAD-dependent oxidoreductase